MKGVVGWVVWVCVAAGLGLQAQGVPGKYPQPEPLAQYRMARDAEIALARSGAPASITRQATILVLGKSGYEVAVQGTNGFVCLVERGWVGSFDWPEMWNPKIRGADCLNPPAARSVLPLEELRTQLVMAGSTRAGIIRKVQAAVVAKTLPRLEPGAMSYMLGKGSYLTDDGGHNLPHLMFFIPVDNDAVWGANQPGSPVGSGNFWFVHETPAETRIFPPLRVFVVGVKHWSDGSAAQ
ncbi:MAG TPA: hypothetical protein VN515_01785 [Terriglobales bacterium]|nr:hypothetical protein [Terriglobales bacterium]